MQLGALEGFTVGITATRRWEDQAHLLAARGAQVVHGPVLDVDVVGADPALRAATEALIAQPPDVAILCTGSGTKGWFAAAESFGAGEALLTALRAATVLPRGPKTVAAAIEAGLDVPRQGAPELLRDLLDSVQQSVPVAGARIAVQLDGGEQAWLLDALAAAGAEVVPLRVYRWTKPTDSGPALRLLDAACTGRLDAVTFTSAPAARSLFALAERDGRADALRGAFARDLVAASVGPVTGDALRECGVRAPLEPRRARLGAMVWALVETLQGRRRLLRMAGHDVLLQGATVVVDGGAARLTEQERRVLELLLAERGGVLPKTALLHAAAMNGAASEHAVEMAVARLRRRLGPAGGAIETVYRRGYRLAADAADAAGA